MDDFNTFEELQSLVVEKMEDTGILPKIQAKIRTLVYDVILDNESDQDEVVDKLEKPKDRLIRDLCFEYLQKYYQLSASVFEKEAHARIRKRSDLSSLLGFEKEPEKERPLLWHLISQIQPNRAKEEEENQENNFISAIDRFNEVKKEDTFEKKLNLKSNVTAGTNSDYSETTTTEKEIPNEDLEYNVIIVAKQAKNLIMGDDDNTSDPYLIISVGDQTKKTNVCKSTLNPVWNERMEFNLKKRPQSVKIECMDWDLVGEDDPLGVYILDLTQNWTIEEPQDLELSLRGVDNGKIFITLETHILKN